MAMKVYHTTANLASTCPKIGERLCRQHRLDVHDDSQPLLALLTGITGTNPLAAEVYDQGWVSVPLTDSFFPGGLKTVRLSAVMKRNVLIPGTVWMKIESVNLPENQKENHFKFERYV